MNDLVSNKKTGFLIIIAFIVVVLGAIYYYFVYPLNEEKNLKEVTVSNVRNEIAVLETQLAAPVVEDDNRENSFAFQKKVPTTRALEELIRSIEQVELISESKIESINFNNYDESVSESTLVPIKTEENAQTDATETTEENTANETPVSPVANIVLPAQLKLITLNISVLTKDYEHLNSFIKELENLERIVRVDQIKFSVPGEEQQTEMDSEETISAEIQLTTFYYDGE
ncbi:potassium transporter [Psychrobacillus glaciei]|uniref:Potassium transporter n=1 Tax=Psychrobacillus glaciei TaxID=2283160 RepID=A0A5J6SNP7_9BACI|nr:type 4a pilus biogenesis protein PilO [Psychrobacillus glaciei]QFF99568.1 potassium transporter [Psychrobacillus glaciei]